MDILSHQYPEITQLLEKLDATQSRKAALEISIQALTLNHIHGVWIDELLEKLNLGESLSDEDLTELQQLADKTEQPYLEALGNDENITEEHETMPLFKQARALSALCAAAKGVVTDSLYEAIHAGVTEESIMDYIKSLSL